ncbi:hypothetical protein ACIQTX_03165 [Microbacterium sp. NPDC090281]|uniref:hypothetical protein n=1 Tax=Microbacterium sp. NPDC090281 TaxID=3364208 RepID=UPI00380F50BA
MTVPSAASAPIRRTKWALAVALGAIGAVIVTLVVLAFVWPVATSDPRDLPIAVSGPSPQIDALESTLDDKTDGLFTFTEVDGRDEAVDAIEARDVYGAILLSDAPEVLTATAANASVASQMTALAAALQAQLGAQVTAAGGDGSQVVVTVTDVVPLADDDPSGAGLSVAAFPLVLGGILGGVLVSLLVVGSWRRITALVVYAVAAGFAVTWALQGLFGILQGPFLLNVGAVALAMFATASLIVGLHALISTPGIGIGAVLTMLIGNPVSAATLPHQFLAGPWGDIGQAFVPGASATLIRDLSYFPKADATSLWLTLGAWAVAGLLFTLLGHFRNRQPMRLPEAELEPLRSQALPSR